MPTSLSTRIRPPCFSMIFEFAAAALDLARAADLWALVDLAGRRRENPVAERADRLLRAVASRRDVHARPEPS